MGLPPEGLRQGIIVTGAENARIESVIISGRFTVRGGTFAGISELSHPSGLPPIDPRSPAEVRNHQRTVRFASMVVAEGLIPEDTGSENLQYASLLENHAYRLGMGELTFAERLVMEACVRGWEELQSGSPQSWGRYIKVANIMRVEEEYPEGIARHEAALIEGPYRSIEEKLQAMSPSVREVFDLHYVNGASPEEIAVMLSTSTNSISTKQVTGKLRIANNNLRYVVPSTNEEVGASLVDDLVPAAVAGDPRAQARLLGEIHPLVLRYCRGRLGRQETVIGSADDVAQEVSLAVVGALPNYTLKGLSFRAFVYGIAAHKVTDAFRAIGRNRSEPMAELPDTPVTLDGPEQRALAAELAERLGGQLQRLTPRQREVLILRVVAGMSAEEVAHIVGSTPGAVRVTQHRALNRLREVMSGKPSAESEGEPSEPAAETEALPKTPRTRRKPRPRGSRSTAPVEPPTVVEVSSPDVHIVYSRPTEPERTVSTVSGIDVFDSVEDVTNERETETLRQDVITGLLFMPEVQQEALVYSFRRGKDFMSIEDIARKHGISENLARSLINDGKRTLGEMLGPTFNASEVLTLVEELPDLSARHAFEAKVLQLPLPQNDTLLLMSGMYDTNFKSMADRFRVMLPTLKDDLRNARVTAFNMLRANPQATAAGEIA